MGFNYDNGSTNANYYYGIDNFGNINYIYDANGNIVVTYRYDAWGKPISTTGTLVSTVGAANPYRYKSYYYDTETGLYYLQSRYYDAGVGRFVNADEPIMICLYTNLFEYCNNDPIINIDINGFWAEKYANFSWTDTGFNVNVHIDFLSRSFCISYAKDIIKLNGQHYWWGKGYKKMNATRIAQELWFHAIVYYVGTPIQGVLKIVDISWGWLDGIIESARYMQINNNDSRAWIFAIVWFEASAVKRAIFRNTGNTYVYSLIKI